MKPNHNVFLDDLHSRLKVFMKRRDKYDGKLDYKKPLFIIKE